MSYSVQASIYKKAIALKEGFESFLASDEGYLSGDFWYSLEEIVRDWNGGQDEIPDCMRLGMIRRGFIQLQDRIHDFDMSDSPEPSADLLAAIAYVLKNLSVWPDLYLESVQPKPIAELVMEGTDFQSIAKMYNMVNPTTGVGVASMAEEEYKSPGTYIAPEWKHPKEIERVQNREVIEEFLVELTSVPDAPVQMPEYDTESDFERFVGLYDEVESDDLIEQARKMGVMVRSNMKRETIIEKIYRAEELAQKGAEDGSNE